MDRMIVYEDDVLIVVHKPAGIATETARIGQADIVSELKNYRKKKGADTYIGVIHRLDQPVEGLLVFAKTADAAKKLSAMLQQGKISKKYAALVAGVPDRQEGMLCDMLLQDRRTNLSRVVSKGTQNAKEARLEWRMLRCFPEENFSLVEVEIFTGRHHQIRVQMSNAGMPLLGDMKYGSDLSKIISKDRNINQTALLANKLSLQHPSAGKHMEFSIAYPKQWKIN